MGYPEVMKSCLPELRYVDFSLCLSCEEDLPVSRAKKSKQISIIFEFTLKPTSSELSLDSSPATRCLLG